MTFQISDFWKAACSSERRVTNFNFTYDTCQIDVHSYMRLAKNINIARPVSVGRKSHFGYCSIINFYRFYKKKTQILIRRLPGSLFFTVFHWSLPIGKFLTTPVSFVNTSTVWLISLGRKQNHTDSLCRKPFFVDGSLGRKQEITDSLDGSQI